MSIAATTRICVLIGVAGALSACQNTSSAVSSYGGNGFDNAAISSTNTIRRQTSSADERTTTRPFVKNPKVRVMTAEGVKSVPISSYSASDDQPQQNATRSAAAIEAVAAATVPVSASVESDALPGVKAPEVVPIPRDGPVRRSMRDHARAGLASLPGVSNPIRIAKAEPDAETIGRVRSKASGTAAERRRRYAKLIHKHARAEGVPVELAMAVVEVESMYRPDARGRAGEVGLMQILPRTARYIGYQGPMQALYDPDTNIRYGMKYLGKAHRLGGGSVCGTILKYNAGHAAKTMNATSRKYCSRVSSILQNT